MNNNQNSVWFDDKDNQINCWKKKIIESMLFSFSIYMIIYKIYNALTKLYQNFKKKNYNKSRVSFVIEFVNLH